MSRLRRFTVATGSLGVLLLACACSSAETAANASEEDSTTCTIGGMNATTGALGFVGKAEIEGMNIALEDINAAGGIQGKPLAFDIADDQGSVNTGTTNFKRLAAKYPIIIGPGITAVAQATAGLATSNKVVMMTFVGQPEVTEGTDYVFEIVGSQNSNTQSMVNYLASEYGVKEASIIAINDAYGTNGLKLLNEAAASSGMKITSTNTFNADAFDFTPQASTIAQEDPPGLLFNGSGGAATPQALKAIRAAGYKGPIVADVTLATQEVPKIAGNEAADTVVAMSQINYPEPNEVTKKFFASYAARNDGGVPSSLNAEGYDAVTVVAMALQETGCNTTGDKLVKALENVTYDGILGVHDYEPGKHAGADASSFKPITFKNGQFAAPADN